MTKKLTWIVPAALFAIACLVSFAKKAIQVGNA
jgi:hypothetical protein